MVHYYQKKTVSVLPGKPAEKEVKKMLEIKGKINTAICYANIIEEEAIEQIRRMCDYEFTEGSRIRQQAGKGRVFFWDCLS